MDILISPFELRKRIGEEEFDYQILMNALKAYKDPQRKRHDLIKKQVIIRIKKGLYIWHPSYTTSLYSKEILANLIYGPSYLSLEYALAYWRLIPERVETITSVTFKKNKAFKTSVGEFTYRYINKASYPSGISQVEVKKQRFALMATPEKAILDTLALVVKRYEGTFDELLFENLRIDKEDWKKLNMRLFIEYGINYRSRFIKSFCRFISEQE